MYRKTGAVLVASRWSLHGRGTPSAFVVGLVLVAVAACSSAPTDQPGSATTPAQSGSSSTSSGGSSRSAPLRVSYHVTSKDLDPGTQTITFLTDGGRKFRITFT